jgi:patatin-like phospholipase/acyl hydrolase
MINILTIDGGGIRGLIPAVILDYIEQELQQKLLLHISIWR